MSNINKTAIKFLKLLSDCKWFFHSHSMISSSSLFGFLLSNLLIFFPIFYFEKTSQDDFFYFWNQHVDLIPIKFFLSHQKISCFYKYFLKSAFFILIEVNIALDIQGFFLSVASFLAVCYKKYFVGYLEIFHEIYYS